MADEEDVYVDILNDSSDAGSKEKSSRARGSGHDDEPEDEPRQSGDGSKRLKKKSKSAQVASQDVQDDLLPPKDKGEADEGEDEEPEQDEDEDEDEEEATGRRPKRAAAKRAKKKKRAPKNASDNEMEEDDGGSFVEGADDDGELHTKKGAAKKGDAEPTNNEGVIERIHLVNFMNHANLEVELGPQINFITGPNGSGKSAILVGLSLCLGATTSFTQRSSKLGEFVREGAQKAIISVTLRNVGPEAFKADLYGPTVTVERTIMAAGTTKYRLKDYRGHVVTSDRSELAPLCDRFNIQINNPCIIMMQETSRDFLGTSTPRRKYELFERATQIKVIQEHLSDLVGDIASAASTLDRKRALFPSLQRQHDAAAKEHDEILHLKQMKESMVSVKAELVWAQVEERESHAASEAAALKEKEAILGRNREKLKIGEQKLVAMEAEEKRLAEQIRQAGSGNDELSFRLTEMREQHQALFSEHAKVAKRVSETPKKIDTLDKRIKKLQEAIALEQAKAIGDKGAEEIERHNKLVQARQELENVQKKSDDLTSELSELKSTVSRTQNESSTIASQERNADREVARLRAAVANSSSATKDPASLWGSHLIKVRDLIKKHAREFRRPPIGPLGTCIKLRQSTFTVNGQTLDVTVVMELQLAKLLPCFWCDNHDDNMTLQRLVDAERVGPPIRTLVQAFRDTVYNDLVMPAEHKDYVRMMDCLECEPRGVFNVLVDQLQIEGSVIVLDRDFGREDFLDSQNVRKVFAPDGSVKNKVGRDGSIRYTSAMREPAFLTLKANSGNGSNAQAEREELERKLQHATKALSDLKKRKTDAERMARNADDAMRHKEQEVRQVKEAIQAAKRHVEEREQVAPVAEAVDAEPEAKYQQLKDTRDELKTTLARAARELKEKDVQLQESTKKLKEMEEEVEEGMAKTTGWSDKAGTLRREIGKHAKIVQANAAKLGSFEKVIEEKREAHAAAVASLNSGLEMATAAFPERVPIKHTVSELENMVAGMERALAQQQKNKSKSIEEIEKDFLATKAKVKRVSRKLDWLDQILGEISLGMAERNKKLESIRKLIAEQVSAYFNMHLSRKGYEGAVRFVHDKDNPVLEVTVNLNPSSQSQSSQDPLTLSGGETSFSTVALLLSLWEVIDTPFRVMDEFDIFMDAIHRQISINVLIEFARTLSSRQFIFLSPLDSSAIPRGQKDIRIKTLDPPIRGNQRQMGEFLQRN